MLIIIQHQSIHVASCSVSVLHTMSPTCRARLSSCWLTYLLACLAFISRSSQADTWHTGRQEILQTHIQKQGLPLGDDVTVDSIAASTTGFTGADLANLINEAALLAGRSAKGEQSRQLQYNQQLCLLAVT